MFWILCGYADFPVSLLLTEIILPVFFRGGLFYDPFLDRTILTMMVFATFYAVVGTAWYFFLPILVEKVTRKIAATVWATAAVIMIMIIPIFAHWLQLLQFISRDVGPTAIRLNCVLPGVWTALLIWLFFTNIRRKVLLWLLLLAPPVFYYLAHDIYYYILWASR